MQKILNLFRQKQAPGESPGALKKKTLRCSTEAAAISIGLHLLLVFFAGSIVLIKYVQKRDAAFAGENISRPKLERRQLQMPVKMQKLQKKSSRPKVTSRMASVSQSAFSLPDLTGVGGGVSGESGFNRSGMAGERDLKSLGAAGNLGFGVSGVNFFGTKSRGEKLIFIVEAEKDMMVDAKGGYFTYAFVKDRLHRMVEGMNSATLFNVIIYINRETVMFRPQLVPATPENRAALKAWLAPLNDTPEKAGIIKGMGTEYVAKVDYESVIKNDTKTWLTAVQAALEQKADNIFILCSGWGGHMISKKKIEEMFGISFDDEEKWLTARGWPPERVKAAAKARTDYEKKALEVLEKENAGRAKKGLPPKIINSGGVYNYVVNELKWEYPEKPPYYLGEAGGRDQYTVDEVIEHLEEVYSYNYIPQKLDKPKIHIVNLIAADGNADAQDNLASERLNNLKKTAQAFRGRFEFLRGAKTMELLIKQNPDIDSASE